MRSQSQHWQRPVREFAHWTGLLVNTFSLYGMEADLGLQGNQYQVAVSLLFITYILSELPSNLVLKRFRPSRWIALLSICWGIVCTIDTPLSARVNAFCRLPL